MQIYSFSPFGYEGALVSVEVDLRRGIPAVDLVGLADSAVKEARERMQAAVRNSGFEFPPERVLISLSPADMKKEGAGFDLPIALGVLCAKKVMDSQNYDGELKDGSPVLVMGELELSGKVHGVRAVHAAVSTALASGITRCIVPLENAQEAREVCGMKVFGASCLEDAFAAMENPEAFTLRSEEDKKEGKIPEDCEEVDSVLFQKILPGFEFGEIYGQKKLVRALQIAAAGGHNIMAVGAPGCGKTMSMQKFPSLLPSLTLDEAQSVTRIYSLAGLLPSSKASIRQPGFRMPHQTASIEGMCGGGPHCRPGEISLAHNGVLFLDEAAEFRTSVLQMLRVPLESGRITLARAGRSTVFPADFQLLLAANPCPCGNYGSKLKLCLCSARSIEMYWKKFSAPLLDRVDLRVCVENESGNEDRSSVKTSELRKGIAKAVKIQRSRQGKKNSRLSPSEIQTFCVMDEQAQKALLSGEEKYGFSPRAVASCMKVARTIADMEGEKIIGLSHMQEAIDLRKNWNNFIDGQMT